MVFNGILVIENLGEGINIVPITVFGLLITQINVAGSMRMDALSRNGHNLADYNFTELNWASSFVNIMQSMFNFSGPSFC
ncbi:unnamed protein product [Camellia sinensis]